MEISGFGVTLRRLTEDKIEMVRNWRNDPKISKYMEFKDYITSEMQLNWFRKVENENNFYFIIIFEGKEIGLVNVRDVDYEKQEGEGGIFIYDDVCLNSDISFRTILCLHDFCFEQLKLKRLLAHIRNDNKRAIQFNKMFGYRILPGQDEIVNQLYTMTEEDYKKKREQIIRFI